MELRSVSVCRGGTVAARVACGVAARGDRSCRSGRSAAASALRVREGGTSPLRRHLLLSPPEVNQRSTLARVRDIRDPRAMDVVVPAAATHARAPICPQAADCAASSTLSLAPARRGTRSRARGHAEDRFRNFRGARGAIAKATERNSRRQSVLAHRLLATA